MTRKIKRLEFKSNTKITWTFILSEIKYFKTKRYEGQKIDKLLF